MAKKVLKKNQTYENEKIKAQQWRKRERDRKNIHAFEMERKRKKTGCYGTQTCTQKKM